MYFYLYDSFLGDKKYEKVLARIEARVADLGIKGRAVKLTPLKQLEESLKEGIERGAKTVVVVGNDRTVSKAINVLANYKNTTLGIVPVGEDNEVAKVLGIPEDDLACDVISNRLIDILDVGRINNQYFFNKIEFEDGGISLECDGIYKIELGEKVERVVICNFGYFLGKRINPKDGRLEVLITTRAREGLFSLFKKTEAGPDSFFVNKYIKINSIMEDEEGGGVKEKPIKIDGFKVIKTPGRIDVMPRRLKVIVGKERLF